MDRLATIEAFVRVSETQSFSEAARGYARPNPPSAAKWPRWKPNSGRDCFIAPPAR